MSIVILCIDDDHTSLTVRQLLLSSAGYTALLATNGETGLKLFNCNRVDLVITDHWLPDRTGAQTTLRMKQLKPEVPIVLLTGLAELPPGYDHADLLLTKCITPEDYLAEIAHLLPTRRREESPRATAYAQSR